MNFLNNDLIYFQPKTSYRLQLIKCYTVGTYKHVELISERLPDSVDLVWHTYECRRAAVLLTDPHAAGLFLCLPLKVLCKMTVTCTPSFSWVIAATMPFQQAPNWLFLTQRCRSKLMALNIFGEAFIFHSICLYQKNISNMHFKHIFTGEESIFCTGFKWCASCSLMG